MSRDLTPKAAANVASGATSGPGTDVCAKCHGPKEDTRLNSAQCRTCARGIVLSHAVRVDLAPDVMEALAADAARAGQTPGERVTYLLTRKYR